MSNAEIDIVALLKDPESHIECVQIAPTGENSCAILYEVGNVDRTIVHSFVFEVENFDADKSNATLSLDEWLTSLAARNNKLMFALEVGRTIWQFDGTRWSSSLVAESLMNRVWSFSQDCTFLIGNDGISFVHDGKKWSEIEGEDEIDLNDIHGPTKELIYCVGNFGSVQHWKKGEWHAMDLPFDHDLRGVYVTADGLVRACGDDGTCIEINGEEYIEIECPDTVFFSVCEFQGMFYWGDSDFGVYVQVEHKLEPFFESGIGYDLRSDANFMYCVGAKTAWRYDGANWKSLELVHEGGWKLR